jgi:hypothetical protein
MNAQANLYSTVIAEICGFNWRGLSQSDLTRIAWAYYFFSIQFRENLEIARTLYPDDTNLKQLEQEECNTSNLSPWPDVAVQGEKLDHDEFMRRTLELSPLDDHERRRAQFLGEIYLIEVRNVEPEIRAISLASYESGGLQSVFTAFMQARDWNTPLLQAFRHFVTEHIRFDGDDLDSGHGALSKHLSVDDRILPLWSAFRDLLTESVPSLALARAIL